jgi:choline/glycine/proline betaine transport protein
MPSPRPAPPVWARIGLPDWTSRLAAALILAFVIGSVTFMSETSQILESSKAWVVGAFDWLFIVVANVSIAAICLIAIHPLGRLRLGPEDSRPDFRNFSWFAMLFSAGLASGILYWATAEPILHQQANPFLDPTSKNAAAIAVQTAMRITLLHWGLHGWAFYVLAGLAIAVYSYRRGQSLTFRAAFYPVLGPRLIDRWPGRAIDLLALFGTICGVATSIGLSAGSINATLHSLWSIDVDLSAQIWIVFSVCGLGVASAVSGLGRGIRRISELNLWVSGVLLAAFVLLGPTFHLGELLLQSLVDYTMNVVPTGLWLADTPHAKAWQGDWTIFYWGWWLAWTPFVSLFIARISRGRTIREFVLAVMIVPTLVTIVWMTVLGGTTLSQEAKRPGSISTAVNQDYSLGLVAVIEGLASPPVATALIATAAFLLLSWLVTSLDSATLVICHLLGTEESISAKIFWGLALAAVAAILLRAGGLPALQAASIVIGLPLALLMLVLSGGLVMDLWRRRL